MIKFKEGAIKPGMVIHCLTEEDARALLEHLRDIGYKWFAGLPMSIESAIKASFCPDGSTAYRTYRKSKDLFIGFNPIIYYTNKGYTITEFSDLLEPDPPEPRFKVGDKVRVRKDLDIGDGNRNIRATEPMLKTRGMYLTITRISCHGAYYVKENGYLFTDEMLEPVENSTPEEKPTDSPINESDLISREELLNQFRLYLNRSDMGETTADSELKIGEIASVIKNCPSASAEKHKSEMSAVEVLEWLADADKEILHIVFDYDNIQELLADVNAEQIVKGITAYEAAKKKPKPVEIEWKTTVKTYDKRGNLMAAYRYLPEMNEKGTDIRKWAEDLMTVGSPDEHIVIEQVCRVKGEQDE